MHQQARSEKDIRIPLKGWIVLLLCTIPLQAQAQETPRVDVNRLSDRVIVLGTQDNPTGSSIIAIASQEGLVVIDTHLSREFAAEAKNVIETTFNRDDFSYVINTHHHEDHTMGNQIFPEARIIAHDLCYEALKRFGEDLPAYIAKRKGWIESMEQGLQSMDPESPKAIEYTEAIHWLEVLIGGLETGFNLTLPNITFNDRMTVDLDDIELELFYFGEAHSNNDVLIFIPQEKLLMTGDVFHASFLASSSGTEIDVPRWLDVLNPLLVEGNVERVVGGHRYNDIWPVEKLIRRRDYIETIWNTVIAGKDEGLSLEDVSNRISTEPFKALFSSVLSEMKLTGQTEKDLLEQHQSIIKTFWDQLD